MATERNSNEAPGPHAPLNLGLQGPVCSDTIVINPRCLLRREGAVQLVCVAGLPRHHWTQDDTAAQAYARVRRVRCGYADQNDVARAFGCSTRTIRRYQRSFETRGMAGLQRVSGRPLGQPSTPGPWVRAASPLRKQGLALRTIAERLRVSVGAVSKWLDRLEKPSASTAGSGPVEETVSRTTRPSPILPDTRDSLTAVPNRTLDRVFARLGLLQEAEPVFASGRRIPRAGVLLAVPALAQSGTFAVAEEVFGSMGPAF